MNSVHQPYDECPRFNRCSVNNCPLSLSYPLFKFSEDREIRCKLAKSIRVRIGGKYELKYQGMTAKEWTATKRCLNVEEKERLARIGFQGQKNRFCSALQEQVSLIDTNVSDNDSSNFAQVTIRHEQNCKREMSPPAFAYSCSGE